MTQKRNLTILQGSTYSADFEAIDQDGYPLDLSGGTLSMQIRDDVYGPIWGTLTPTIVDPVGGEFTVAISAVDTRSYWFDEAVYDVNFKAVDGTVTRLFEGSVMLSRQVTII